MLSQQLSKLLSQQFLDDFLLASDRRLSFRISKQTDIGMLIAHAKLIQPPYSPIMLSQQLLKLLSRIRDEYYYSAHQLRTPNLLSQQNLKIGPSLLP